MALADVPQPGQSLSATQNPIRTNFSTIDTVFAVNHVGYGVLNAGMHKFIQMPAATPTLATAAGQIGLYAKTGVSSGQPELYFQRQSLAADAGYAITEFGTGTFATATGVTYSYQWTRMPCGVIQLWGTQTNQGPSIPNGGLVITFPTSGSFPGFASTCYNVSISEQWNDTTGSQLDRPIAVLQGLTTRLQFSIIIQNNAGWTTKGSISFTAIGI